MGGSVADYNEIYEVLIDHAGYDLANRFENLIADVANACYDEAAAEKLGGRIIDGVFDFGDDSVLGRREFRVAVHRG